MTFDAPFSWTKQVASDFGGTRNGMVIHWPKGIKEKGGLRSQFTHVIDVAPTILEAAGLPQPKSVNGTVQTPIEGTGMLYAFNDAKAPDRHKTQYLEMFGNRAIYHGGWLARTIHAELEIPADAANGAILSQGGRFGGWSLYMKDHAQQDGGQVRCPGREAVDQRGQALLRRLVDPVEVYALPRGPGVRHHGTAGASRVGGSRALVPLNTLPAPAARGRSTPARRRRRVARGPRAAGRRR